MTEWRPNAMYIHICTIYASILYAINCNPPYIDTFLVELHGPHNNSIKRRRNQISKLAFQNSNVYTPLWTQSVTLHIRQAYSSSITNALVYQTGTY